MAAEQKRVRQMVAVSRLRAMQSGQAMQRYAQHISALQQAQETLRAQQAIYTQVVNSYLSQQASGVLLDPAMHGQRLQSLLGLRSAMAGHQEQVNDAQAAYQLAKAAVTETRTREHIADQALTGAEQALTQHRVGLELIDIFDAQQAGGIRHGV